jgi:TatD DNase family protein
LGVPLRVGLFTSMVCLYGQTIFVAIPNAKYAKIRSRCAGRAISCKISKIFLFRPNLKAQTLFPEFADAPFIDFHTHSVQESPDSFGLENLSQVAFERALSDTGKGRFFSAGLHPWFLTPENFEADFRNLAKVLENAHCLSLGECGLDRLRGPDLSFQVQAFEQQIQLAETFRKPIVVHCVRAFDILVAVKKKCKPSVPMVVHGFNQNAEILRELIRNDFYFSLGAALIKTENSAELANSNATKAMKTLPIERLLLETDDIYTAAAESLNLPVNDLKRIIYRNFLSLFEDNSKFIAQPAIN